MPVFDFRKCFSTLDGQSFESYPQLRKALVQMRLEHLTELPPGTGPDALYVLATKNGWVHSVGKRIIVSVKPPEPLPVD